VSNIGFIGLGNMGVPMALNLVAAGHEVRGFDVKGGARATAAAKDLELAASNADAARDAEIVILMLPNGTIVESVVNEVLPAMRKDSLLIDCSTIDVTTARKVHEMAANAGVLSLDAPVSGGVVGAEAGTLTFMVGGSDEAFAKGAPLFDIMGARGVHCGEGGAGQAAKICNNMLLGISMIGACEAFALAKKLGLSQSALFDVISTSSGSCWSVNTYCPVPGVGPQSPADNDYKPGFAAALMLKDLGLSQQAAEDCDAATPLGRHATDIYQAMNDGGDGNADFSGVIRFIESRSRRDLSS
jgi:3-hydroxyisobutyrate dehydrogenase